MEMNDWAENAFPGTRFILFCRNVSDKNVLFFNRHTLLRVTKGKMAT